MRSRLTRILIGIGALTLAAPAAAAAAEAVAPPGSGSEPLSAAAAVETDPGCAAKNVVAFKGAPQSRVRHVARMRCTEVAVRARCVSKLILDGELLSRERTARANRCRAAVGFAEGDRYPAGTEFLQRYRFKLTLKKDYQRWTNTTEECPKRSKNKRTLVCRGSQTTAAPERSVEKFSS